MKVNDVRVSIIMPVYNSGEYLKNAVYSILNQSLAEIELILVDDGSTDGSSECCDDFARKDQRVRVIHQKNCGICAARNEGMKIASGEYIAFSDHDDEYGDEQLKDNYRLAIKNDADIVKFGSRRIILDHGKVLEITDRIFKNEVFSGNELKEYLFMLWKKEVLNGVWDSLFKRDFIKKNNICFDTYYQNGGEDFDFCWQCVGKDPILCLNEKIYYRHYIRNGFSTSSKFKDYSIKVALERPQKLMRHVEQLNIDLDEYKRDYTYFWLKMSLGPICYSLVHPNCLWSIQKKLEILESLSSVPFFKPWILNQSPLSLRKIAPLQYLVLLWLYQHKKYIGCMNLYRWQYKKRKIARIYKK